MRSIYRLIAIFKTLGHAILEYAYDSNAHASPGARAGVMPRSVGFEDGQDIARRDAQMSRTLHRVYDASRDFHEVFADIDAAL